MDSVTQKPADKFIQNLRTANKNDPHLEKYVNGFKIAKPVMILGIMYYAVIPFVSTFFGEKISNKTHQ